MKKRIAKRSATGASHPGGTASTPKRSTMSAKSGTTCTTRRTQAKGNVRKQMSDAPSGTLQASRVHPRETKGQLGTPSTTAMSAKTVTSHSGRRTIARTSATANDEASGVGE